MLEIDPETAYEHARAAYQSAARIDVVREALGLTAYATGRYSEALRELRTYRRMSDDYTHVPLEADSERGLGRPEKALRFIEGIPLQRLSAAGQIELALVTSGARAETDDSAGGLSVLEKIIVENLPQELAARVQLIKADRLEELGRTDEAEELRAIWGPIYEGNDGDIMVDLDDVLDDIEEPSTDSDADSSPNSDVLDEDVLDEDVLDEDVLDEDVLDEDLVEIIDAEHAETDGSDETPDAARAAGEGFVQDSFDFAGSLDKALEEDQDLDLNEAEGKE
ncbi:tetratricopeptide repeat protein [Trueperella pyogenes]